MAHCAFIRSFFNKFFVLKFMRYHGNWCGPNWSNAKRQRSTSVWGWAKDDFDRSCRLHDWAYATSGADLAEADAVFAQQNRGRGWKRSLAASYMEFQGKLRESGFLSKKNPPDNSVKDMVPMSRSRSENRKRSVSMRGSRSRSVSRLRYKPLHSSRAHRIARKHRVPGRLNPRRRNNYGLLPHSRSSGFIRFKGKKALPKRQKILSWYQDKGVIATYETGVTDNSILDAFYIGHATFAQQRIQSMIFKAIVKMLFNAAKEDVPNWALQSPLKVNDTVTIYWKQNLDDATAETVTTFTTGGGGTTYLAIAEYFHSTIGNGTSNMAFTRAEIVIDASRRAHIPLAYAVVYYNIKSSLKIQNTTAADVEQPDWDVVNNVPIYGKGYTGGGTGALDRRIAMTEVHFVVNDTNGVIYKIGSTAGGTAEMPPGRYFHNCKAMSKAKIDPGAITTNNIYDSRRIKLNTLTKYAFTGAAVTKDYLNIGKYAFFGFEHMIKATNTAPALSFDAEVNQRYAFAIVPKWHNITDEYVTHTYYEP